MGVFFQVLNEYAKLEGWMKSNYTIRYNTKAALLLLWARETVPPFLHQPYDNRCNEGLLIKNKNKADAHRGAKGSIRHHRASKSPTPHPNYGSATYQVEGAELGDTAGY